MDWSDLVGAANRRDLVRLADGRTGRLVYAPIPREARRGAPRTEAGRAVVEVDGRRFRVAPSEVTELVEAGKLVRPAAEQCGAKRNYNKAGAKKARDQAQATTGVRLELYRCPHCDYWHLGSPLRRPSPG